MMNDTYLVDYVKARRWGHEECKVDKSVKGEDESELLITGATGLVSGHLHRNVNQHAW